MAEIISENDNDCDSGLGDSPPLTPNDEGKQIEIFSQMSRPKHTKYILLEYQIQMNVET